MGHSGIQKNFATPIVSSHNEPNLEGLFDNIGCRQDRRKFWSEPHRLAARLYRREAVTAVRRCCQPAKLPHCSASRHVGIRIGVAKRLLLPPKKLDRRIKLHVTLEAVGKTNRTAVDRPRCFHSRHKLWPTVPSVGSDRSKLYTDFILQLNQAKLEILLFPTFSLISTWVLPPITPPRLPLAVQIHSRDGTIEHRQQYRIHFDREAEISYQ